MSSENNLSPPLTRPRRPFTAYDIFYQLERERFLQAHGKGFLSVLSTSVDDFRNSKRNHNKSIDSIYNLVDTDVASRPSPYRHLILPKNWRITGSIECSYKIGELSTTSGNGGIGCSSVGASSSFSFHHQNPPRKKRCRQSSSTLSLVEVSKSISKSWSQVDSETKRYCQELASKELERYQREVEAYVKRCRYEPEKKSCERRVVKGGWKEEIGKTGFAGGGTSEQSEVHAAGNEKGIKSCWAGDNSMQQSKCSNLQDPWKDMESTSSNANSTVTSHCSVDDAKSDGHSSPKHHFDDGDDEHFLVASNSFDVPEIRGHNRYRHPANDSNDGFVFHQSFDNALADRQTSHEASSNLSNHEHGNHDWFSKIDFDANIANVWSSLHMFNERTQMMMNAVTNMKEPATNCNINNDSVKKKYRDMLASIPISSLYCAPTRGDEKQVQVDAKDGPIILECVPRNEKARHCSSYSITDASSDRLRSDDCQKNEVGKKDLDLFCVEVSPPSSNNGAPNVIIHHSHSSGCNSLLPMPHGKRTARNDDTGLFCLEVSSSSRDDTLNAMIMMRNKISSLTASTTAYPSSFVDSLRSCSTDHQVQSTATANDGLHRHWDASMDKFCVFPSSPIDHDPFNESLGLFHPIPSSLLSPNERPITRLSSLNFSPSGPSSTTCNRESALKEKRNSFPDFLCFSKNPPNLTYRVQSNGSLCQTHQQHNNDGMFPSSFSDSRNSDESP